MIGQHVVTVSSDRSSDAWGAPINVNPYFELDASGWTLNGGTGWGAGSIAAISMSQAQGSRAAYVYKDGTRYRIRVLVSVDAPRNVTLALYTETTAGPTSWRNIGSKGFAVATGSAWLEAEWTPGEATATDVRIFAYVACQQSFVLSWQSVELNAYDASGVKAPVDISCLVDEVNVQHGRDDPSNQPEASSATLDLSWFANEAAVPSEVEVGARVEVATIYPADWLVYAWTGTPDGSTSTKSEPPNVVTTNAIRNPTFRNDLNLWALPTAGNVQYNVPVRRTSGGVDNGAYMDAWCKVTGMPAPAPPYQKNAEWASVQLVASNIKAGDVVAGSFYVKPTGSSIKGVAVQAVSGPVGDDVYRTLVSAPLVNSGGTGPWQRFTFKTVWQRDANGTASLYFTYRTADAATIAAGAGWSLDHVCVAVNPPNGEPPDYFDGASLSNPPNRYTRFVGRITDVAYGWDDAGENTPNTPVAQIVATSFLADLGRRVVGAEPWPQELDGARVRRVLGLAGVVLDPSTSDPGSVQINPRDVDSQPALEVVHGTAVSAQGIVWATRGGAVRYADSEHRRNAVAVLALDACDVLVTPTWVRNTDGLVNKVSLGYGVPPEGGEQPRYTDGNAPSITKFGEYAYGAETELATLADAQALGSLLLARNATPTWVMGALPVDMKHLDDARTATLLGLEMHDLLSLTGLPAVGGAPTTAALWVEGWQERLAWGVHELALNVSGYCRSAPPPRWDDVATAWDAMTTLWDGMTCLGPTVPSGRWTDTPATLRWNDAAAAVAWDAWT